jgi:hypothetical protein
MTSRPVNGRISVRIWSTEHIPCLKQLAQSDDSPPTGSHRHLLSRENCYRVPVFARSSWDDFTGYDEAAGRGDRQLPAMWIASFVDVEFLPVPEEAIRSVRRRSIVLDSINRRTPGVFAGMAPYDLALRRRWIVCSGNPTGGGRFAFAVSIDRTSSICNRCHSVLDIVQCSTTQPSIAAHSYRRTVWGLERRL